MNTKKQYHFDSANISESYSGIVLPLTQTFAKMVYSQVYQDLLRNSGISNKKLAQHKDIFENLLAFFYGRMYYNMNNWYLMAAFFPGYKRNKRNFEAMITSNIKEEIDTSIKPTLFFTIIYPLIIVYKSIFYPLTVRHFKNTVTQELRSFRSQDLNKYSYLQCIEKFKYINKKLLRNWYVAIENDFFVMTYLGIIKKFADDQQLQRLIRISSKSTEQIAALNSLSKSISRQDDLWRCIKKNDQFGFTQNLLKHPTIKKQLQDYLVSFGGRFANELKLESIGIDEDLSKLFETLKIYKDFKLKKSNTPDQHINLPLLQQLIFNFFLKRFKHHAALREEFRLLRSNTFGASRQLFRRTGRILTEQKIINEINDVFYLNLDEILNKNITRNEHLKLLIQQRKKEFASFKSIELPTHFSSADNIPPKVKKTVFKKERLIQASPASSGKIKGRVRIFKEYSMPDKIDFDILVTSHTDPGWTSLIALSKGLIIEHGGVLSHASIVARELNIPAVIGAKDAMLQLKNNQLVEIDGSTGSIKLLS